MNRRRGFLTFFIVLVGAILGAILGHVLRDVLPILDKGLKVGTDTLGFNLYLIDLSFSIHVNITLGAIIGILIAFLISDIGRRRRQ
jgi:multisubunit Na+/H+ antiporter MnhE subunit